MTALSSHLNGPQTTGRHYRNLTEPTHSVRHDVNVGVPVRDGITLLADVHRPDTDGRFPALIAASPYPRQIQDLGAPMDVLWFRVPVPAGMDASEVALGTIDKGGMVVAIPRGDYWQCAQIIEKGGFAPIEARGIGAFRERIVAIGSDLAPGAIEIDAAGKLVLPGGVDSHCHIEQLTASGLMNADTFETATRSAAFGGTTTGLTAKIGTAADDDGFGQAISIAGTAGLKIPEPGARRGALNSSQNIAVAFTATGGAASLAEVTAGAGLVFIAYALAPVS